MHQYHELYSIFSIQKLLIYTETDGIIQIIVYQEANTLFFFFAKSI